jgi:CBS domain-containing protein
MTPHAEALAGVSSIMTRDVEAVAPETSLVEVRELFAEVPLHHLPVVVGEQLVGLISFGDIVRAGMEPHRLAPDDSLAAHLEARHIMQERAWIVTANEGTSIREAAAMLCQGQFHALPVIDADDRLLGIVTSTDLIRYLMDILA